MSKVFSDAAVKHFNDNFKTKVGPGGAGGCMKAVYVGLGSLYGSNYGFKGDFFKSFYKATRKLEIAKVQAGKRPGKKSKEGFLNTVDRVFRALEKEGVTGAEQQFTPIKGEGGGWMLNGSRIDSIESSIESQLEDAPNGPHFFGIAIRGGIHSLTIQVVKSDSGIQVFWMDQFSEGTGACRPDGFVRTPDVTGSLDETLRSFGLSQPTSMWIFLPEKAEDVLIPIDSDGDGTMDSTTPAVIEVQGSSANNKSSQLVPPTDNLGDSNNAADVTIEGVIIESSQLSGTTSLVIEELADDAIEENNEGGDFEAEEEELDEIGEDDNHEIEDSNESDDFEPEDDELDEFEEDDSHELEEDSESDDFEPEDDELDDFEEEDSHELEEDNEDDDFEPEEDEPDLSHDEPPPSVEDSPDVDYYEAPPS